MSIFGAKQSVELAKSIAKRAGIEVLQKEGNQIPYVSGKRIIMGEPGIYTHEVYMQELHKCIGQVCRENDFFNKVKLEGREDTMKEVVRAMHTDKFMHGEYDGRDRQLAAGYKRTAEGINLKEIAEVDTATAALLALGNELRNEWQGFNKMDVPEDLQPVVDKLRPLGKKWMSLETEVDLVSLLHEIEEVLHEEEMPEDASGDSGDDSGGSEEPEGESSDGAGEGEGTEGEDGDSSGSGESGSDDDGDPSDPSEGEASDSGGDSGDDSEDSGGEVGGEPEAGEEGEDSSGGDSEVSGDPEEASSSDPGKRGDKRPGGSGFKKPAAPIQEGDAGARLKDLGIIPPEHPPEVAAPYTANCSVIYQDNRLDTEVNSFARSQVEELLKDFRLTQKVKKYLLTLAQVGWNTGLKSGTLNSSRIHRLYSTQLGEQPRIYKKREKPKLKTDIAISLLIDDSGSMRRNGKVYMAAASAIGMSEVLQSLKIPHDILMFTTEYDKICHTIVKDYSEAFVSRDRLLDRLNRSNIRLDENADGEAVLWAAQRLMQVTAPEKLLIVLSDGRPSFSGTYNESTYLKDVVKTIENAKGIDVLGIGILDDSVSRFYKRYELLRNLNELEALFMRLLQSKIMR